MLCDKSRSSHGVRCCHAVFALLLSALPLLADAQSSASTQVHFSIAYTGRLLGYARAPESQSRIDQSSLEQAQHRSQECTEDTKQLSEFTRAMLALASMKGGSVLVGMGDNFALDLNSRTFDRGPGKLYRELKDRFAWVQNIQAWVRDPAQARDPIPMDNVGCFLRLAGYTAVVPGKHDFWFGPERLEQLAEFLSSKDWPLPSSNLAMVRMLAANVTVVTNVANQNPRLPQYLKDDRTVGYKLKFPSKIQPDLPAAALPYLRQFRFKNARQYTVALTGCLSPNDPHVLDESLLKGKKIERRSSPTLCPSQRDRIFDLVDSDHHSSAVREIRQIEKAYVCLADPTNPDRMYPSAKKRECTELVEAEDACDVWRSTRLRPLCEGTKLDLNKSFHFETPRTDLTYVFAESNTGYLSKGGNFLLCVQARPDPESKPEPVGDERIAPLSCKPFSVHMPFLKNPNGESQEWAYDVKAGVAIFGVLDSAIEQNVGMLNSAWLNRDHSLDTSLEFVPPDSALSQLLQKCAEDSKCVSARKVLLAQMAQPKAAQLFAAFPSVFDLTISEADYEHDTGNETQQRQVRPDAPDGRKTGFLVTPRAPFEPIPTSSGNPLVPHLAIANIQAAVTKVANPASPDETLEDWSLENKIMVLQRSGASSPEVVQHDEQIRRAEILRKYGIENAELANRAVGQTLVAMPGLAVTSAGRDCPAPPRNNAGPLDVAVHEALRNFGVMPQGSSSLSASLIDLALLVMQRTLQTDIAMIQARDIFDDGLIASSVSDLCTLQDRLNSIFWKGDVVVRTTVTGAMLKKLDKASKQFAAQDRDALSTELEKGRAATFVGFKESPDDQGTYFVNGKAVEDAGLYSIATTDFLALGDTGYPDIKDPLVSGVRRMKDFEHNLYRLSGLICMEIARSHFGVSNRATTETSSPSLDVICEDPIPGNRYLDPSSQQPFDRSRGYTTLRHYEGAFERPEPPVRNGDANGVVQQRSNWSVILESADLSYAGTIIKNPLGSVKNFAGVSVPQVKASEANTLQEDYRLRLAFDRSNSEAFALSESKYQTQWNRSSKSPYSYSTTQPFDTLAFELGIQPRIYPAKRPSGFRGLFSLRYEQPLRPLDKTSLSPLPPPSGGKALPSFLADTAQSRTVYGKAGLHEDFGSTWIEAGFRYGKAYDLLDHYVVAGVPCFPTVLGYLTSSEPSASPDFCLSSDHIVTVPSSSQVTLKTRENWQSGIFLNFNFKIPLNAERRIYFTLANQGSFFFGRFSDRSIDTRYQDIFTPALAIPLFGKFSLQPKADFFMYENQINHWHFRSVSPGLSLQYQFAWRVGEDLWRALSYGSSLSSSANTK
jgi:hypothetical protein